MEKLLIEILNELKTQQAVSADVWAADDIARYLRLSRSSIQSRVICRKDFPRAVRIPTDSGMGGRRWYAKEVKYWLSKNREPIQH
jgi:predicted DNA-binding transcriptional regulator AlpA